ncbi:MAG: SCO family protein [Acidimicrobiales bacterium]
MQGAMLLVLVALLIACYELFEGRASKYIATAAPVVVTGVTVDTPLPNVTLTQENGAPTTLSALRGKVVVLAPFSTLCGTACAATTSAFTQLKAKLAGAGESDKVALVELSVDPAEDTPARLASFAQVSGSSAQLLTGSAAQVAQLWKALGQFYQVGPPTASLPRDWLTDDAAPAGVTYSNAVYFIGNGGNLRVADFEGARISLDPGTQELLSLEGVTPTAAPSTGWTVTQAIGDVESVLDHRFALRKP